MIITYWHWLAFGLALMAIEVVMPGFVFFWLGLGALATGITLLLIGGLTWEAQLLIFAGFAAASVAGWIFVGRRFFGDSGPTAVNERTSSLVGQVFVLTDAIENGRGRIKIGDGSWVVTGDDLPAGRKVRVTGSDGNSLRVEAV